MPTNVVAEIASLAAYALGAGALAVLGLAAEYNSLQHVASGDLVTGLWLSFMGGLALLMGVILARRKLFDRLVAG